MIRCQFFSLSDIPCVSENAPSLVICIFKEHVKIRSVLLQSVRTLSQIMSMLNFMRPFMLSCFVKKRLTQAIQQRQHFHQCMQCIACRCLDCSIFLNFTSNLLILLSVQPLFGCETAERYVPYVHTNF